MAIEIVPLPLPASADASKFKDFGREVKGVKPGELTPEQFEDIRDALYRVGTIWWIMWANWKSDSTPSTMHCCSEMLT
jgi:hypothetical protein